MFCLNYLSLSLQLIAVCCWLVQAKANPSPQTHQRVAVVKTAVQLPLFPKGVLENVLKFIMAGFKYSILLTPSSKYPKQSLPDDEKYNDTALYLDIFNGFMFDSEGNEMNGYQLEISNLDMSNIAIEPLTMSAYGWIPFSYMRAKPIIAEHIFPPLFHFASKEPFVKFRMYDRQSPLSKMETTNEEYFRWSEDYNANQLDNWMIHILAHVLDPSDNAPLIIFHWESHFFDIISSYQQSNEQQRPLTFDFMCDFTSTHNPVVSVVPYSFSRFSFNGQEEEVIAYFHGKRNGIYVDIGANDGIRHSNTYALEKYLGWSGLLVEPLKRLAKDLLLHRNIDKNSFLHACVYDKTFQAEFLEVTSGSGEFSGVADSWPWFANNAYDSPYSITKVPCFHIQDVLDAHGLEQVDYLSVDAEGADLIILEAIEWTRFSASVVSVECHEQTENEKSINNPNQEQQLIDLFMDRLQYKSYKRLGWDLMFFK